MLPPVCKIVQRYALIERHYSSWETVVIISAIVGLIFVFRNESNFVNMNKYINDQDFPYNNVEAYIFGLITIICWALANMLL